MLPSSRRVNRLDSGVVIIRWRAASGLVVVVDRQLSAGLGPGNRQFARGTLFTIDNIYQCRSRHGSRMPGHYQAVDLIHNAFQSVRSAREKYQYNRLIELCQLINQFLLCTGKTDIPSAVPLTGKNRFLTAKKDYHIRLFSRPDGLFKAGSVFAAAVGQALGIPDIATLRSKVAFKCRQQCAGVLGLALVNPGTQLLVGHFSQGADNGHFLFFV